MSNNYNSSKTKFVFSMYSGPQKFGKCENLSLKCLFLVYIIIYVTSVSYHSVNYVNCLSSGANLLSARANLLPELYPSTRWGSLNEHHNSVLASVFELNLLKTKIPHQKFLKSLNKLIANLICFKNWFFFEDRIY